MRKQWARIREDVPELAPFTDDELAGYVAAAQRKLAPGTARWTMSLMMGFFVLGVIALLLIPTMWIWGWMLMWLYDRHGTWAVGIVIGAFALAVLALLRMVVGNDRADAPRYTNLLSSLARAGECARCRYRLAGLSPIEGRANVICCPECGLMNPMPRESPDDIKL